MSRSGPALVQTRTWFVVFDAEPESGPRWWWDHVFTRPRYRHVAAMAPEMGGTLYLNPCLDRMDVRWLPRPIGAAVAAELAEGRWVLRCDVAYGGRPRRHLLFTCVEAVKALLGLDWPTCVTPWQLARRLRRAGAIPVIYPMMEECDGRDHRGREAPGAGPGHGGRTEAADGP